MSRLEEPLETRAHEVCVLMESGESREGIARHLRELGVTAGDSVLISMRAAQLLRLRLGSADDPSTRRPVQDWDLHNQFLDYLEDDGFAASIERGDEEPNASLGWIVVNGVEIARNSQPMGVGAVLRMSDYPIDPGFGQMRCQRSGATWAVGAPAQGGTQRWPELGLGEAYLTLTWEAGDMTLLPGDLLVPERPPTAHPTFSSDISGSEVCPVCGGSMRLAHSVRVRAGLLRYDALGVCGACHHETTISLDRLPEDVDRLLRERDGLLALRTSLERPAILAAALAGAAEIEIADALRRIQDAEAGAPLFVGPHHAAEVVAQRLETAGREVRRSAVGERRDARKS